MKTTIIRHSTEETSWLKIKEAVNCNGADSFQVRDKILTTLKDGQQVEFVVAGINLYSKNELVLVLGDDLLKDECVINRKCTNAGGWAESYLRKYCNNEVYELLPDELKAVITPRKIMQVVNGVRYETEDKLWALSEVELFGGPNGVDVEDVHFPIFDSRKSRIKFRNGYQDWYSTRSPLASSSTYFCLVGNYGSGLSDVASSSNGVAFGFLIKP